MAPECGNHRETDAESLRPAQLIRTVPVISISFKTDLNSSNHHPRDFRCECDSRKYFVSVRCLSDSVLGKDHDYGRLARTVQAFENTYRWFAHPVSLIGRDSQSVDC